MKELSQLAFYNIIRKLLSKLKQQTYSEIAVNGNSGVSCNIRFILKSPAQYDRTTFYRAELS